MLCTVEKFEVGKRYALGTFSREDIMTVVKLTPQTVTFEFNGKTYKCKREQKYCREYFDHFMSDAVSGIFEKRGGFKDKITFSVHHLVDDENEK